MRSTSPVVGMTRTSNTASNYGTSRPGSLFWRMLAGASNRSRAPTVSMLSTCACGMGKCLWRSWRHDRTSYFDGHAVRRALARDCVDAVHSQASLGESLSQSGDRAGIDHGDLLSRGAAQRTADV